MNQLAIVLLLCVSAAFASFSPVHNFQVITNTCPDHMNPVDLVWAVDASSSVGLKRYLSGLDFIHWATKAFGDTIPDKTRMALYEFDETQYTMFVFDTYKTNDEIVKYVDSMKDKDQNGTSNSFVQALDFARTKLFDKARPGVEKVLVFVADGWTDESVDDIAAASKRASDAGIKIFFIGYEADFSKKVSKVVVGGDESHISFESVFSDVSVFSGCATPSTPPVHEDHCVHGSPYCINCPAPFFGDHCEYEYTCDYKPAAVIDGLLTRPHLCHDHGICTPTYLGPKCVCDKCWKGEWCSELETDNVDCAPSDRCIAYQTDWTKTNKTATIQNLCDLQYERCIPDDIDCLTNVAHSYDKDGKPQCIVKPGKQHCECPYPVGYCLPLPAAQSIFKSLVAQGAHFDKVFLGSS